MKRVFTNSNLIRKIWILYLFAVVHFTVSGQTSHSVEVTSNLFTPNELTINEGDTVVWTNSQGNHNVNGLQSKFPSNPESFGNDVGQGWVFSQVFNIPGAYDYQCDPHVSFGMVGKVTVLELPPDTLTMNFTGMTPHVGQMLTLYVRKLPDGEYLDTIIVDAIEVADFDLKSYVIEPGSAYLVDFFADHNGNGMYDAPPADHAWRIETGEVMGNAIVEFTHSTDFTNIFVNTGLDPNEGVHRLSVYPNPASNQLHVSSNEIIDAIFIYNVMGARLLEYVNLQARDYEISVEGINSGVYVMEIRTTENKLLISRFVKR